MERTADAIRADIARLQMHIVDFKRLAAARKAAAEDLIAEKLLESAADLERQVDELRRMMAPAKGS